MIVGSSSVSRISVQSKKGSHKTKASPSQSIPDSPQGSKGCSNQFPSYQQYWSGEGYDSELRVLSKTVLDMEKNQTEMQQKFQKCIEQMLCQIERNNENNSRLAMEVNKVKTELSESKKDILIIEEFLQLNQQREPRRNNPHDPGMIGYPQSTRDLLGSASKSKNILSRRQPSKLFKSKMLFRQ